jgi:putative membrane-bound dehydrogenase-like protein
LSTCALAEVSSFATALASEKAATAPDAPASPPATPTQPPIDGPLTPDQAIESFTLEPGLRIELAAAEPEIDSPVAVAFDDLGRMFVAENRGYPNGPSAGAPPMGRIALLEDVDGDGRFEKRTTFADGLTFPNGLLPWDGGLIVTCAPDILYLKDTDHDGRADQRTVWLTGFSTKGSTQLRVSHPTLGIDGWIYVTSGLTGGEVTCPSHPQRPPLRFGRTDFRFRADLSQYETCDGGGQFGLSFDEFGHRLICYNRVPVQHVVMPSRYLRRNPHLAFSETVQDCPTDLAPEPLKGHGQGAVLFPISANVTTADSHAGTFTAACSVLAWRGSSLPERYRGGAFSCDPTGNLVHFDRLVPRGATFAAERATPGVEFLASRDNWFRPVFLAHGPDGALYLCDMYRKTIEHPDYLPVEIRKRTDFESGRGMGRIWRVVDDRLSARELKQRRDPKIQSLDDQAGWQLDLTIRHLWEAAGKHDRAELPDDARAILDSIAEPIRKGDSSNRLSPPAQVALFAFAANHGLPEERLIAALKNPLAPVREQALTAAEPRLAKSPEVARAVLQLVGDVDPRVRFQWALSAGQFPDARAIPSLAALAARDAEDRWLRAAVLSSIAGREEVFLAELLLIPPTGKEGRVEFYNEFGRLLAASQAEAQWAPIVRRLLRVKPIFPGNAALLAGFATGLRNRGTGRVNGSVLFAALGAEDRELRSLFELAAEIAADSDRDVKLRGVAISLLAHADFAIAGDTLLSLVDPAQPAETQSVAIRALCGLSDERIAPVLLSAERFPVYTPAVREEVLAGVLSGQQHLPGLLTAIEQGVVPSGAIDSIRRKQLTEHKDAAIRDRAKLAFGVSSESDRGKIYEEYKTLLALPPNSDNGHAVFKKHCANCHRLDREGYAVGPDLFGIRNQPKEAILLHILIPEQEITQGFLAYVAETKDGRVLTGLVASETANSVTLKQALGKEETILRVDLERLTSSKLSLMPQEFEKAMSKQELADLISYLKGEFVGVPAEAK